MSTDAPSSTTIPPAVDPAQLQERLKQAQAREAQLTAALAESSQTVTQQQELLDKLTHELALLKRWVFGSRRERFGEDDPRQQKLFEVSEGPAADSAGDLEEDIKDEPRGHRRGHGRKPLPQFLPRKTVEYTLPESELGCPCCGQGREKISQVVSEQLEHTPASLFILEHV